MLVEEEEEEEEEEDLMDMLNTLESALEVTLNPVPTDPNGHFPLLKRLPDSQA